MQEAQPMRQLKSSQQEKKSWHFNMCSLCNQICTQKADNLSLRVATGACNEFTIYVPNLQYTGHFHQLLLRHFRFWKIMSHELKDRNMVINIRYELNFNDSTKKKKKGKPNARAVRHKIRATALGVLHGCRGRNQAALAKHFCTVAQHS